MEKWAKRVLHPLVTDVIELGMNLGLVMVQHHQPFFLGSLFKS
jgi:hypothetical protein